MSAINQDRRLVTPTQLRRVLRRCARADVPAFVWGMPGIGKSDNIEQLAEEFRAWLIDVRASQLDAVDTRGVPYVDHLKLDDGGKLATTRWAVPSFLPSAEEAAKFEWVFLFLDELNAAPPAVQAALYQLILNRRLGDYVLPTNVRIFAAGNLETDRAVTHRMSTALAGRFAHFELMVNGEDWERWALGHDIHEAVIFYRRWRPENLHNWDAKSTSKAQPTPRTWEFTSRVVADIESEGGESADVELALMCGLIGDAVGHEFAGFLRIYRQLPDPDAIIMTPDAAPIPSDPATLWALCGALAKRTTRQNIARVFKYATRMRDETREGLEFMTCLVRAAVARDVALQSTPTFIKWAADNSDVLL